MEPKKPLLKRKIIIIPSVILIVLIVLASVTYFIVHGYINKMNIVTDSGVVTPGPGSELADYDLGDALLPEEDKTIPDSSKEEVSSAEEKIKSNLQEGSIPVLYDKNVFNVLLIGGDSRKPGGAARSDAMILVSINKSSKKITVTSLLRDIYLEIPGKQNNRLNAAYAFGGADLLLDTVEQNFKVKADKYASIDFYSFMEVVDAVGGVTIDVTEEEIPVINRYIKELNLLTGQEEKTDFLTAPGKLLLNGKQALGYSRNRYVGNSDFERTARQRRVLEQIFNQVKDLNILELKKLFDILLPQITTNLTEGEIFTLLLSLPSYVSYDIEQWSIPMAHTYTSLRIRGMEVLGIDFEKNINELHQRAYASIQ